MKFKLSKNGYNSVITYNTPFYIEANSMEDAKKFAEKLYVYKTVGLLNREYTNEHITVWIKNNNIYRANVVRYNEITSYIEVEELSQ